MKVSWARPYCKRVRVLLYPYENRSKRQSRMCLKSVEVSEGCRWGRSWPNLCTMLSRKCEEWTRIAKMLHVGWKGERGSFKFERQKPNMKKVPTRIVKLIKEQLLVHRFGMHARYVGNLGIFEWLLLGFPNDLLSRPAWWPIIDKTLFGRPVFLFWGSDPWDGHLRSEARCFWNTSHCSRKLLHTMWSNFVWMDCWSGNGWSWAFASRLPGHVTQWIAKWVNGPSGLPSIPQRLGSLKNSPVTYNCMSENNPFKNLISWYSESKWSSAYTWLFLFWKNLPLWTIKKTAQNANTFCIGPRYSMWWSDEVRMYNTL